VDTDYQNTNLHFYAKWQLAQGLLIIISPIAPVIIDIAYDVSSFEPIKAEIRVFTTTFSSFIHPTRSTLSLKTRLIDSFNKKAIQQTLQPCYHVPEHSYCEV
jgi:hypothetical protein